MRKILSIIFILFAYTSFAQPEVPRSGKANTVVDQRWKAGLNAFIPVYLDTIIANLSQNIGIDSAGAIIYTYSGAKVWIRKHSPKRWEEIGKDVGLVGGNLGLGYRLYYPPSQGIKTVFGGYGMLIDSSSNSNGLTFRPDTSVLFPAIRSTIPSQINYTASNGLSLVGSDFRLGGTLSQNTTINANGFLLGITNLPINDTASYDLTINSLGQLIARPAGQSNVFLSQALTSTPTAGGADSLHFTGEINPWPTYSFYGRLSGELGTQNLNTQNVFDGGTTLNKSNTFNSGSFNQIFDFPTLGSGAGLSVTSTSTSAASNSFRVLEVNTSGVNTNASQSTIALRVSNTHTGANAINYGVFSNTSGGVNNYAGWFEGQVRVQNNTLSVNNGRIDIIPSSGNTVIMQPRGVLGGLDISQSSTTTNDTIQGLTLRRVLGSGAGVVSPGFGTSLQWELENGQDFNRVSGRIVSLWSDTTNAVEKADLIFLITNNGNPVERFRMLANGSLRINTMPYSATVDSLIGWKNGVLTATLSSQFSGSGGGGLSGGNLGSAFRLYFPPSQGIKTVFSSYGITLDSSTSNQINFRVDTNLLSTRLWRDKLKDSLVSLIGAKQNIITESDDNLTFSSNILGTNTAFQALTDGATITFTTANGINGRVTLGGNRTLSIPSPQNGKIYAIKVFQGTGGNTLALPGGASAVLRTGAGDSTLITGQYDGTNGSWMWYSDFTASVLPSIITVSASSTLTAPVDGGTTVLTNCSGGAVTHTFPSASSNTGRIYRVKKMDSSGNAMNITTIEGSLAVTTQYSGYVVQSDGTNWLIIGVF